MRLLALALPLVIALFACTSACITRPQGKALPLPTPGLVLLLGTATNITVEDAATRLQKEFQRTFPAMAAGHPGPDPPDFVVQETPHLQIAAAGDVFRLTQLNRPYVEDVYRWPFIKGHHAWLAVDSLSPNPTAQTERTLARILAALATGPVIAIYLPASDRMVPAPAGLLPILRSPDPIALLFP